MGSYISQEQEPDPASLLQQFSADDTGSMTALQWASSKGYFNLVEHLLDEAGVDIDYHTTGPNWEPSHSTALHHAIQSTSIEIVKMLLEKGADINISDEMGYTVVHWAATGPSTSGVVEEEERMKIRQTRKDRQELLRFLLSRNPDLSLRTEFGLTPLHTADNRISMEMLLGHGVPINSQDNSGNTILHYAADEPDFSTVGFVFQPRDGKVRFLLGRGADPSIKNFEKGLTPLHIAAANGYHNVAEALLEGGADPKATNKDGLAPVDYIRKVPWTESRGSYARMVELLLRASGVPSSECRSIADERHPGDKPVHDKYGKQAVDKFLASLK